MRIIFLSKRQYMQKDVIDDRYGRLYELPNQLARRGHQVKGICLSYRHRPDGIFKHYHIEKGLLVWNSFNTGMLIIPGLSRYFWQTVEIIKQFKPDVLVGCSDAPHVIITALLAKRLGIPFFIDLYDNFESFGLSKLPFIIPAYRSALQHADGVICVSDVLSENVRDRLQCSQVLTLESTINATQFTPGDKSLARKKLGLLEQGKIIGVAGSLARNRGINILYNAFSCLIENCPDLHLALAGPVDRTCPFPEHPNVHYLGLLDHQLMCDFYRALDLAAICMINTEFGRYAFPQKAYEIMACKTPLLTAALGALQRTLTTYPQCLYEPENQDDFNQKVLNQLCSPTVIDIAIPTWKSQAERLEVFMSDLVA